MKVAVIIPNFNGRGFLPGCLDSLGRMSFKDFAAIVVDNGSTDGSVELLREHYPQVMVIGFAENRGFSAAVNEGIRQSEGDFVALLNNDTEVEGGWLGELVGALEESGPEVGSCVGKILYFDRRERIDSAGDGFTRAGFNFKRGWQERDQGQFDRPEMVFGACAGAALYRRAMLKELGGFDEGFFAYLEDVDLSFRAQLKGYGCLYVPQAVAYHHFAGTSSQMGDFPIYQTQKNLVGLLVKDMPTGLLVRYLPSIIGFLLISALYYLLRGKGGSFIRGRIDGLREIRSHLKKRQEVQGSIRVPVARIDGMLEKRWLRVRLRAARAKRM
ncbi:MAG: glycosyltransferase family 2 protein [Deltaproteobacteria bacterium]|nr:MAG: glycosyltransferase family 2 protein [Deltaproteobacteria bacterium]